MVSIGTIVLFMSDEGVERVLRHYPALVINAWEDGKAELLVFPPFENAERFRFAYPASTKEDQKIGQYWVPVNERIVALEKEIKKLRAAVEAIGDFNNFI